jgi:hypothetical protein
LSQQEQTELRQMQRRQEQVAEESQRLVEQLEKLIEQLRSTDPAGAESLAQALRAARSSDVVQHTQQAADAVAANRTAAALMDQRNAESGMNKMLAGLQERQRRQLAELQKRIEDFRVAITELLQQQRDLLAANSEAGLLDSERAVFAGLSDDQHLLARNTAGVAADMDAREDVPGPTKLVQESVEPMDDARNALKDASWQLAQERQQVASDRLVAALAELEELARKADEEAFKRTVTALLIELGEIRQSQTAINDESSELIGRVEEGERLDRMDFRKVVGLARDQEGVRTSVSGISNELTSAQVYRWVLEQIDQHIGTSIEHLDRREIDAVLADAQDTIIRELDVLIGALRDASALPPADEYEEQLSGEAGGGGTGGADAQARRVPGIAELLVLKSMQADLNKRIEQLPPDFDPDTASEDQLKELRRLAARQEEIRRLTKTVTERAANEP